MMDIIERARALRAKIEESAQNMDNEEALEYMELFPKWGENHKEYKAGQKVRYAGFLYEILSDHISQSDWTPSDAPSLFARILAPEPEKIYDWEQPDSTNGYQIGAKIRFNGSVYVSLIDNNIWSPEGYPAGWRIIE